MQISSVVSKVHSMREESYQALQKIAEEESIELDTSTSKVELILAIIAKRVIDEEINARMTPEIINANKRKNYRFEYGYEEYFFKLTSTQVEVLRWCVRNKINFSSPNVNLYAMPSDKKWETP